MWKSMISLGFVFMSLILINFTLCIFMKEFIGYASNALKYALGYFHPPDFGEVVIIKLN